MSLLQLRVKSDMFANNFLRHYGQFKYDLHGFSWKIMKLAHETFFYYRNKSFTALLTKNVRFEFQHIFFSNFSVIEIGHTNKT